MNGRRKIGLGGRGTGPGDMRSVKAWAGANGGSRENLYGRGSITRLSTNLPESHQLPPQATSTGQTRALMSSRLPGSMALSVMWSFPRVWTSLGPSLSTQRKGKELGKLA